MDETQLTTARSAHPSRILVVDDDAAIRLVLRDRLRAFGHDVAVATDGAEALASIASWDPAVVLLDLRMPNVDGFGVLEGLSELEQNPQVIVVTAHGSIEAAVRAIQLGATDFIPKPFDYTHLEHVIGRCVDTARLRGRVAQLETELSSRHTLVAGTSPAMVSAIEMAGRAAASKSTILLLGESGSGKEVLARYVHRSSAQTEGPFIAVNCAMLSAELMESELFGHEKGAFTGATQRRIGRIEQAAGGTLFLDETAELAPNIQAKLLRVLQEREFERLGGSQTLQANVRLIAATHRDLPKAIEAGAFRQDLYYRLNVVSLRVPSLRDRREDLPALIDHFVRRHAADAGHPARALHADAQALLLGYDWPGNVRELSNAIERAVVLTIGDEIRAEELPEAVRDHGGSAATSLASPLIPPDTGAPLASYQDAVRAAKQAILRQALARTDQHQTKAAKLLGLSQPYMARLIKNLGLRDL